VTTISISFVKINLPQSLHFSASLLGETLLYHRSPLSWYHMGNGIPPKIFGGTAFSCVPSRLHHCRNLQQLGFFVRARVVGLLNVIIDLVANW